MDETRRAGSRGAGVAFALCAGYVGIYLCRKNLAVAVPLLEHAFGVGRTEVGRVASLGTLAYAAGKLTLGPMADRLGGRRAFLASIAGVIFFGAVSALAPGMLLLAIAYAANRFAGAGGWPAMMKLVPSWFAPERTASIVAVLSLSYVFGGVAATLLAREVVAAGGGWRAVFVVPALVLAAIAIGCALWVRSGPRAKTALAEPRAPKPRVQIFALLRRRQFLVVCALSFTLTLMRETFNTWSVDFLLAARTGRAALAAAALQSTAFDIAGAASILGMGLLYDRLSPRARRWLIFGVLLTLAVVLYLLPAAQARGGLLVVALIAATGLLVYGPYSLLAGALAVESGGAELAGAASGIIDAIGYAAGILSGGVMGRLLDAGGYRLGLHCLAGLTAISAAIALGLGRSERVVA